MVSAVRPIDDPDAPPEMPLIPVPEQGPELVSEPAPAAPRSVKMSVPAGEPIPADQIADAQALAGPASKERFHATMRDFGDMESRNRGSMLALDPNDPDYIKKLAAHQAEAGVIRGEKAHYEQSHPWGSMESAHPGIFGKIGHAFGEIGNVAGEALAPRLAEAIPGSKLNLESEEAAGAGQIKDAAKTGLTAATTKEQEASASRAPSEIAQAEAATGKTNVEAKKLADAGPKLDEQYASAVENAISHGVDPATDPAVQRIGDAITSIQKQSGGAGKAPKVTYNQGIPVTVEDGAGNSFDIEDPNMPDTLKPLALRAKASHIQSQAEGEAKQQRAFAQREKMFALQQNALTNATKTMVEASPKVIELSERIKGVINKDVDALGPLSSRWRELWAGKIGAEDKEFTKLRTDVGLLNTLLMRMHVGARGGVDIMHHFQDLLDSGKQDPGNMLAALEEIDSYAKDVRQQGESKGVHTSVPGELSAEATPPSAPSPGKKWQHRTVNGKLEWRQIPK